MIRAFLIVAVGLVGVMAQAAVDVAAPVAAPGGGASWAGLEKLGVAGVTVALLFWLLWQERAERKAATARLDALQEEIRKAHVNVISEHAEAMRENARASQSLAGVIGRCARAPD